MSQYQASDAFKPDLLDKPTLEEAALPVEAVLPVEAALPVEAVLPEEASPRNEAVLRNEAETAQKVVPFRRQQPSSEPAGDLWLNVIAARADALRLPQPMSALFGPLVAPETADALVIAQLGQSLDGRIATHTGQSKYISGEAGLLHLHRLRCLVDAVVIGIGTALADDPLLTVRLCAGEHPARVIIDPSGRVPARLRMLREPGGRIIVVTAMETRLALPDTVEIVRLPCASGHIEPAAIVAALRERGLKRLLIEGGAQTLSRFVQAGALDRLHILVAPIILGSGQPGLDLPRIDSLDEAIRPNVTAHLIGHEVVFDCAFRTIGRLRPGP